jgi:hypothetical protein
MQKDHRDLVNRFLEADYFGSDYSACIDWALYELSKGHTAEDICILAGLEKNDHWEIKRYIERIVSEDIIGDAFWQQTWAGKAICRMYDQYRSGALNLSELEKKIDRLYVGLGYPLWLVMLARNCEYATDTDAFTKPFEEEFEYIASLWRISDDLGEFLQKYKREISNSHDLEGLKKR